MTREFAVVGGWAAANAALALGLLAFHQPMILPLLLFLGSAVLVAMFGLVVTRGERAAAQLRQPHRARTAALAAIGVAIALTGLAYGWWLSLFAVYPLVLAAWSARGERLRRDTTPWPAALDDAEPVGAPRLVHDGISLGTSVPVPSSHPGHGPPRRPPPAPPRVRVVLLVFVVVRALARSLVRALVRAVRGRRR